VSLPLLVIQPGQKLTSLADTPGDFSDWILAGMGRDPATVPVLRPQQGDALPAANSVGAVVISGSGAMVTEQAPWMLATAAWLRELVTLQRPILGICFGHQLLAYALGGEVADNPNGIEVGTVTTRLTPAATSDVLFAGLSGELPVQASHRQSVVQLPPGSVCLAASSQDPHHAFRFGGSAWGVQFHPEFDADIVAAYVEFYASQLPAGYLEQQRRLRTETPAASQLLRRFSDKLS
jgi:GMP synthase (glutamine-hydrolysing)